jgi:arylsulfatase A-like enzyme
MGAAVPPGQTERPVHHVDVAATAAELLGVKVSGIAGLPLRELLL